MRDFFKKFRKEDAVIDLGDMEKRGIIKKRNEIKANKEEVVDLTKSSPLGFLGTFVASSASSESSSLNSALNHSDGRTKLKGILRDMKLDLKNTTDRIYKLTDRLDLIEKKIDRLERRAGVSSWLSYLPWLYKSVSTSFALSSA